jgi:glutamyl-tRNA reductase
MAGPDILQVGVDHRGASLEALATLHALRQRQNGRQPAFRPETGLVALTTCHRLELYLEGCPEPDAPELFRQWLGGEDTIALPADGTLVVRRGEAAARHLLRVAAGLESAVLGEDQILMQVRQAYREACATRTARPLLHRMFHAAFRVGKRVRSETALASGGRSLAGAGVAAVQRVLGDLGDASVLVLGLGEMGALAARRLRQRGVGRLVLSNRTRARAEALAGRLGAEVLRWEWRVGLLPQMDAVICATGASEPVLPAGPLREAAKGRARPLVVVDLAVPRNVERPSSPSRALSVIDLDDLSRQLEEAADARRRAVRAAAAVVDEELGEWVDWARSRAASGARRPGACRRGLAAG